ncbi:hypothetical protein [Streptomyces sp. DG1A-41]|uniref:hypothetical protein n=1 Tax=Streptomyces sp. DG1A-41 TaxID=3125779 RepID=UPI0030CF3179
MGHHLGVVHGGQDGSREHQGHRRDDRGRQIAPRVRISSTAASKGTRVVHCAVSGLRRAITR